MARISCRTRVCLADPDLEYIRTLCTRLFRVYAHAYLHHYEGLLVREWGGFLRCCFGHFVLVSLELDLIRNEDLLPLRSVVEEITGVDELP